MSEPYRPSCGSEGADFMLRWCDRCERDRAFREDRGDSCPIAAATVYQEDDPKYPKEWRWNEESGAHCTAFTPNPEDPAWPVDPAAAIHDLFQSINPEKERLRA
jgi:hypothetical protein